MVLCDHSPCTIEERAREVFAVRETSGVGRARSRCNHLAYGAYEIGADDLQGDLVDLRRAHLASCSRTRCSCRGATVHSGGTKVTESRSSTRHAPLLDVGKPSL